MVVTFRVRRSKWLGLGLAGLLALAGLSIAQMSAAPAAHADDSVVVFDSIPGVLPPHVASVGFEATKASEFGDRIELTPGTGRALTSIEVGFSSWACETGKYHLGTCETTTPGASFTHPVTVNVYAEGTGGLPGAKLASTTKAMEVPFRPSHDLDNCADDKWWNGVDCSNGLLFTSVFDFDGGVVLPDRVIVSVVYSTMNYGPAPLKTGGHYDALNVAVEGVVSAGADADPDEVYLYSKNEYESPGDYEVFRSDVNWDPYGTLMLKISTTLEPGAPVPGSPPPPAPNPDTLPTTPPAATTPGTTTPPETPPAAGGTLEVSYPAGTFGANEWVQFVFYSTPTFSGAIQASGTGALSGSIPVPSTLTGGAHTLVATGTTSGIVSTAAITVSALAVTGLDAEQIAPMTAIAALALLVGAGLVFVSVRRRHAGDGN